MQAMHASVGTHVGDYFACACVALCVHVSGSEACKLKFTVCVCVCLKDRKKGSYNQAGTAPESVSLFPCLCPLPDPT